MNGMPSFAFVSGIELVIGPIDILASATFAFVEESDRTRVCVSQPGGVAGIGATPVIACDIPSLLVNLSRRFKKGVQPIFTETPYSPRTVTGTLYRVGVLRSS